MKALGVKRRDLLVAATGLGLTGDAVLKGFAKAQPDSSGPARNVLLIVADDQGYDLSCCGGQDTRIGRSGCPGNVVYTRIRNRVFL